MTSDFWTIAMIFSRAVALIGFGFGIYIFSRTYPGDSEKLQENFATAWLVVAIGAKTVQTFLVAASQGVKGMFENWFGKARYSPRAISVSLHFSIASVMLWFAYLEMMWRSHPSIGQATSFLCASAIFTWTAIQAGSFKTWRRWIHYGIGLLLIVATIIGSISPETLWMAANSISDTNLILAAIHPSVTLLSLFLGTHAIRATAVVFVMVVVTRVLTEQAIESQSIARMFTAFALAAILAVGSILGVPWLILNVLWRGKVIGDLEVLNLLYATGTIVVLVPALLFVVLCIAALLNGLLAFAARMIYPLHKWDWDDHKQRAAIFTATLPLLWWAIGPFLKK